MPTAPKRECAEPTCHIRLNPGQKCPTHYQPWLNSKRRNRLPSNWRNIRQRILTRDNHLCYLCGQLANEVDHIIAGDNHQDSNLKAICTKCHRRKSAMEGVEARKNKQHGQR